MNEYEILIDNDQTAFQPGDEIRGKIKWFLEKDPETLTLGLFWKTSGRGTEDIGVPCSQIFDNPGLMGEKDFVIKCPAGPYSFSGQLISIEWGLELTGEKGKNAAVTRLTIGPNAEEIVCTNTIEDDSPSGSGRLQNAMKKFKSRKNR